MDKRLGLIVPSSNSVMEVDFYKNLPPDISLHVASNQAVLEQALQVLGQA
jgi:maleate cis-trans isomerase